MNTIAINKFVVRWKVDVQRREHLWKTIAENKSMICLDKRCLCEIFVCVYRWSYKFTNAFHTAYNQFTINFSSIRMLKFFQL